MQAAALVIRHSDVKSTRVYSDLYWALVCNVEVCFCRMRKLTLAF